jgi:hypothetical protein
MASDGPDRCRPQAAHHALADAFQIGGSLRQCEEAGLNAPHIVGTVLKALRRNDAGADAERSLTLDWWLSWPGRAHRPILPDHAKCAAAITGCGGNVEE